MSTDNISATNSKHIDVLPAEADALTSYSNSVRQIECRLGSLRAEYINQESRLIIALTQAYEDHNAFLKSVGRRYCADQSGAWTYDPILKALVKTD